MCACADVNVTVELRGATDCGHSLCLKREIHSVYTHPSIQRLLVHRDVVDEEVEIAPEWVREKHHGSLNRVLPVPAIAAVPEMSCGGTHARRS
jgi:hypothetical protein